MKLSYTQKKFFAFFVVVSLLFSCGWRGSAFLAGCLTGILLSHALDHHHHTTTTVVHETPPPTYEVFYCHNCNYRYSIIKGSPSHTCPRCKTIYEWRQ